MLAGAMIASTFATMGAGQLAARSVGHTAALPWGCAGPIGFIPAALPLCAMVGALAAAVLIGQRRARVG